MTRENVEIVRSAFSAFAQNDVDKLLAAMSDPTIQWCVDTTECP